MTERNETVWRFVLAGASCMSAAAVTNPIDVIKIRMQLDQELSSENKISEILKGRYYRGILRGGVKIVRDEGLAGLYKGLPASLMREGSYSTIRLGAYEPLKQLFGATDPSHTPLWKKICAGAISGAIGSAIATPTDLVKVRMQACRHITEGNADRAGKRYKNTLAAFKEIWGHEGLRGLYVGMGPTVQRAAILTATQIPSYDHTKHTILNHGWMGEGVPLHLTASMIAGFVTASTTSPVDVIKTRIMNQKSKATYTNSFDCAIKTLRAEGLFGLYKGFIPNWMRIGPHTIVTFFIFEQLRKVIGMAPV
ncbi:mitochondrial substrate carrier family protein ucpB-like [Lineus longissimus]|uniref:mitochondrial substrate carrier family protein ucpB-like n=1 Tax=Lineus longissimus TaxID=88925 RepID=UPI002B4E904E